VNRPAVAAVTALAAIGLLGACQSQPSAKAVAKDAVQSITVPGGSALPQAQQDCMLGVIDDMSESEIEQLGEANVDVTIGPETGGNPAMREFVDRLQACQGATGETTPSTPDAGSTATTPVTTEG